MTTDLQKFDKLKADIVQFVAPCLTIVVKDDDSCKNAIEVASQVKSYLKKIEELRKAEAAPLLARKKTLDDYAKSISAPLDEVETHLKKQLVAWEKVLAEKRAKAFAEAEAERKKKEAEALAAAKAKQEEQEVASLFMPKNEAKQAEIIAKVETERAIIEIDQAAKQAEKDIASMKVAGTRKTWTFTVENPDSIPRAYLCIDERAIRQAIKDGIREIPGVNIFQETSVAIGGR